MFKAWNKAQQSRSLFFFNHLLQNNDYSAISSSEHKSAVIRNYKVDGVCFYYVFGGAYVGQKKKSTDVDWVIKRRMWSDE